MRVYEVFIQDEYNNNWFMGFYKELSEAIPDINNFLEPYNTHIDELESYASTFDECFDREIECDDDTYIMIRGFIFDEEILQSFPSLKAALKEN